MLLYEGRESPKRTRGGRVDEDEPLRGGGGRSSLFEASGWVRSPNIHGRFPGSDHGAGSDACDCMCNSLGRPNATLFDGGVSPGQILQRLHPITSSWASRLIVNQVLNQSLF